MTGPRRIGAPLALVAAAALLSAASCERPLTSAQQLTIDRLLICIECDAPLQDVLALATVRPRGTVDSLNVALLRGPSGVAIATADSVLQLGYQRDSAWRVERALPLVQTRAEYVDWSLTRYREGYRVSGATGLGWIHDARAVAYLTAALSDATLSTNVRAAVRYALDSLPPHP